MGLLLAGGGSRRFGANKLLHPLADGSPVALAAAGKLVAACEHTVAVVRPGQEALAALLAGAGCEVVSSAAAELGMGHSLAAGVLASPEAGAWLVALADMPYIAPATYAQLAAALRQGHSLVAPFHQGQRGHPVGFAGQWRTPLSQLQGYSGAKEVLQAGAGRLYACAVDDPGVLHDIDRPEDLL